MLDRPLKFLCWETMLSQQQYLRNKRAAFDRLGLSQNARIQRYKKYAKVKGAVPKMGGANSPIRITSRPVMSNTPPQLPRRNPKASSVKLSDCLLSYAASQLTPFNYQGPDPCIPDTLCTPSYKFNASCKTEMYVGVDGAGYALFNPWIGCILANTSDCPVIVTLPAFTGTAIKWTGAGLYGVELLGINTNTNFSLGQIAQGSIRLVGAGAELIYAGKVVDQAGVITTLQNDGLKVYVDGTPMTTLKNNPRAIVCANSKIGTCHVNYYPTNSDVLSYRNLDDFLPSAVGFANAGPRMGITVLGATPGTAFEVRFKAFFELQLPGMNVTASHSDPVGLGAYQTARALAVPTSNPKADLMDVISLTMREVATSVSGLLPAVGTAVGSLLGAPVVGTALGITGQTALNAFLQSDPTPI